MFTEMALFTAFITAGILTRKKPRIHRTMMLMTGLTIVPGATVRIAALFPIFGTSGWNGLFGAVFCLGALLLVIRSAMMRRLDTWFAASYGLWVAAYVVSTYLATSGTWDHMPALILG